MTWVKSDLIIFNQPKKHINRSERLYKYHSSYYCSFKHLVFTVEKSKWEEYTDQHNTHPKISTQHILVASSSTCKVMPWNVYRITGLLSLPACLRVVLHACTASAALQGFRRRLPGANGINRQHRKVEKQSWTVSHHSLMERTYHRPSPLEPQKCYHSHGEHTINGVIPTSHNHKFQGLVTGTDRVDTDLWHYCKMLVNCK